MIKPGSIPQWIRGRRRRPGNAVQQNITPIAHPDLYGPVDYPTATGVPGTADAQLYVAQLIGDLHSAGALDGGTGDVLDPLLERMAALHAGAITQTTDLREFGIRRLIAEDRDNATREGISWAQLTAEHDAVQAREQSALAELLGQPAPAAPSHHPAHPRVPATEVLPDPARLPIPSALPDPPRIAPPIP